MNVRKHRVLARQTLIPGEDAGELAELEAQLAARLRPAGAPEEELFDDIVTGFWRLRRVEAAVMADELRGQRWRTARSSDAAGPRPDGVDRATIELGAAFQAACDTLGQLNRYETSILCRTKQALAELEGMREEGEVEGDVVEGGR